MCTMGGRLSDMQASKKKRNVKRKKAVNSKWKNGVVDVVVMQNHKIRSKVETSVKSVGFLSFGSSSPPVLQCLLLLLVSANVLTGCSSAPPPFCSQASLHIFSNKKKKEKEEVALFLLLFCGDLILFKPQEVE